MGTPVGSEIENAVPLMTWWSTGPRTVHAGRRLADRTKLPASGGPGQPLEHCRSGVVGARRQQQLQQRIQLGCTGGSHAPDPGKATFVEAPGARVSDL